MMKRLAPKGKKDEKIWLRVARGMDEVDKVVRHGKELIGIDHEEATRTTPLENEIIKWRAHLRKSEYLEYPYKSQSIRNMNEDKVNSELKTLTRNVGEKRSMYFEMAKSSSLQNIRYKNLSVKPKNQDESDDESDDEISPYNSEKTKKK